MPILHWGDGLLFDLHAIREKTKSKNCLFVLDGTQAIGALPYNQEEIQADALIVSAYKWLLGPYNLAITYYSNRFDNGTPIEEHWLNRKDSENFQFLTNYRDEYRAGARRYEMGEAADFIKIPMLNEGLKQLLEWTPERIQKYCKELVIPFLRSVDKIGYKIPDREKMAYHLFGIIPPKTQPLESIKSAFKEHQISVSFRKNIIRISPYVYNTQDDLSKLENCLSTLEK